MLESFLNSTGYVSTAFQESTVSVTELIVETVSSPVDYPFMAPRESFSTCVLPGHYVRAPRMCTAHCQRHTAHTHGYAAHTCVQHTVGTAVQGVGIRPFKSKPIGGDMSDTCAL